MLYKILLLWLLLLLSLFSNVFACNQIYPTIENNSKLLIFVSTSMPEKSLQLWASQADILNAPLYLRGFVDNDLRTTIIKTKELFEKQQVGKFQIYPEKFKEFKIKKVPAVVLITGINSHDVIYGDIGLEEALRQFKFKSNSTLATTLLDRYYAEN